MHVSGKDQSHSRGALLIQHHLYNCRQIDEQRSDVGSEKASSGEVIARPIIRICGTGAGVDPLLQTLQTSIQGCQYVCRRASVAVVDRTIRVRRAGRQIACSFPPVHAHLFGFIDRADNEANLNGKKLHVIEIYSDVTGDDDAGLEHTLKDIGKGVRVGVAANATCAVGHEGDAKRRKENVGQAPRDGTFKRSLDAVEDGDGPRCDIVRGARSYVVNLHRPKVDVEIVGIDAERLADTFDFLCLAHQRPSDPFHLVRGERIVLHPPNGLPFEHIVQ